jgi:hypothetical protein
LRVEIYKKGWQESQTGESAREAVIRNRRDKLTALLHHLTVDVLRASFFGLKKFAAPGVDEMTWTEYAKSLEENLADLHSRVQTGAYRALPSRRTYIPKPDGRQRPLGIAALEDKIVQAAVVAILTPIYEAEFLGFSYGFRPKRNQHQALDAPGAPLGTMSRGSGAISDARATRRRRVVRFPCVSWRPIGAALFVRGSVRSSDLLPSSAGKLALAES